MRPEDVKSIDRVYVFKGEIFAGTIVRQDQGATFKYDAEFLELARVQPLGPVAYTLPLEKVVHETHGDNLHPFFAGLLPEGRRLTTLISRLKTSADDMFSLLAASGTDSIGDIFVSLEKSLPSIEGNEAAVDLQSVTFSELFERSLEHQIFSDSTELRVAGIQPKLSAERISFPITVKERRSRYILKLGPEKFPKLVENEHFFMEMARACGLDVAETAIVYDRNDTAALLVKRFDRRWDRVNKKTVFIHQEDACQLLARYPQDKYRLTTRQVSEAIERSTTAPIIEISLLLKLLIFSYIIGNGDMHSKNVSIIAEPNSTRVVLAPGYDIVSTLPYGDNEMALELEGRKSKLRIKDFTTWAGRHQLRDAAVRSIISEIMERAKPFVERVDDIGLSDKDTALLQRTMNARIASLATKSKS